MAVFLRKYATATTIYFPLISYNSVSFTSTASLTTADMKISVDGGSFTTSSVAIVNVGSFGYSYTCRAGTEMTGKTSILAIHHTAATPTFEDTAFILEMYGNTGAIHTFDLSIANQTVIASAGTVIIGASGLSAGAIVAGAFSAGAFAAGFFSAGGVAAGAISLGGFATGAIDSTKFVSGAVDSAAIGTGAFTTAKFVAGFLSAGGVAAGALSSGAFAAGFLSAGGIAASALSSGAFVAGAIDGTALNASAITKIENGIWNASMASHLTTGTFGLANKIIRDGTAAGGGSATITLDAGAAVGTANLYVGSQIYIYGGVGTNQAARLIIGYNSGTQVATVAPPWQVSPDATSLFIITPPTTGAVGTDNRVFVTAQTHTAGALVSIPTSSLVIAGTVNDKTGYSASIPTNSLVIAGTVSDKTGYSLSQTFPSNFSDLSISVTTGAIKLQPSQTVIASAGTVNISAAGVTSVWSQAAVEPTAVPLITASLLSAFSWLFALSKHKLTQTATLQTLYQSDGSTTVATATYADDATTFTKGSWN